MKHALTGIVAFVIAGGLAASCGGSGGHGSGSPASEAGSQDGTTSCGGSGEPCCNETACNAGLTCISAACRADTVFTDATPDSNRDAGIADVASGGDGTVADATQDASSGDAGSAAGTCRSGTYAGTFACTFQFSSDGGDAGTTTADAGGSTVTGTISFRLAPTMDGGGSFDTASGAFSGTAGAGLFSISADVGGTLNCSTGVFAGSLSNGTYGGSFISGTFSSPLDSHYNDTTFSFVDGTWALTVPGQGSCPGTWTASYTGP